MRCLKKIMPFLLILTMMSGCGQQETEKKITVTTTIFPIYDWVMNITAGNPDVEVRYLLDRGSDLHSFQPSSKDIMTIVNSDLFVYVGGESDKWVEDVLNGNDAKSVSAVNLMTLMGEDILVEEEIEGMQHDHEDGHEHEEEYDEHVWLSLKNAEMFCRKIAEKIVEIDPANRDTYQSNLEKYCAELEDLEEKYSEALSRKNDKVIVVADRFPFRYLAEDYDIDYFAAFSGCSAESEASFETVVFLAEQVDKYGLDAIFHIESSDGAIAETVKNSTAGKNQQILILDSLQAVTAKQLAEGTTYLKAMESNLQVLKQGLGLGD